MNVDYDEICEYAHDDAIMVSLVRKYCKGCYLHIQVGSKITASITPHSTEPVPQEGATISQAIASALLDWLKEKEKHGTKD